MLMFDHNSTTRYDLNFRVAGIPVRVHPLFWVLAVVFGAGGDLLFLPLWVAILFVSILIHELGHALALRAFGLGARIVLHAMGGLAIPEEVRWGNRWAGVALGLQQNILVALAGPGAGFALAGVVMLLTTLAGGRVSLWPLTGSIPWLSAAVPWVGSVVGTVIHTLLWVNVFWGFINLLPVFPLDGGQVARYVWLGLDPLDGVRWSLWLSVVTGALVAVWGLATGNSFMALFFGFMAFQSYQSVQTRFY